MESATSPQIFTVSGLNYKIKHELRSLFPHIQVKGEISNLKKQASGHVYFTLKDSGAQVSCALFRGHATGLALPKEGDQIIASGQIDVYAPRGQYQLIVTSIKREGLGDLLVQLEELKKKLRERGWFDKKLPLPAFPKRIGVITSPTGAVIRDICHVLERRSKQFHLTLNPVTVQGESCPAEVVGAIELFNAFKNVDVIIVARGGGSIEDLWGFNSEKVAEAIFKSEIPIISAIGHETDTTICDLVADLRAPTPSAAAELVMRETSALIEQLKGYQQALKRAALVQIKNRHIALERFLKHPLLISSEPLFNDFYQRLDNTCEELIRTWSLCLMKKKSALTERRRHLEALKPKAQVLFIRQKLQRAALAIKARPPQMMHERVHKLEAAKRRLESALLTQLHNCKTKRRRLASYLEQLHTSCRRVIEKREALLASYKGLLVERDPRAILKKGYAIVFSQNKESIILSSKELQAQKAGVWIRHSDGETQVEIKR